MPERKEREHWLWTTNRAYTRLINSDQMASIRDWLEAQAAVPSESEPGPRYQRFGELTEPWYLDGELIAILHQRPVVYGKEDFTIRLECSIKVSRQLIKAGAMPRRR